jgi:magnesium-transporting ATPase (P-type)
MMIKKLPPRDSSQEKPDKSEKNITSQKTIEDKHNSQSIEMRQGIPKVKIVTAFDQRARTLSLVKQKTSVLEDKENSPNKEYKPRIFSGRSNTKHKTEAK